MIVYRDMTFCANSKRCSDTECPRNITKKVEEDIERVGLPVCMADFTKCLKNIAEPKQPL